MSGEEAIEAAMRAVFGSCPLRVALSQLYDEAYKAGDLDRQRFERSIVKPKRAKKGKR